MKLLSENQVFTAMSKMTDDDDDEIKIADV